MRYLVTGGDGFIGSHLSASLVRDGQLVRSLARSKSRRHDWPGSENVEQHIGDFGVKADAARALRGIDVCFHLACSTTPKTSNEDPLFDINANLMATVRLLEVARSSGLKRLIFVSSGGTVYGPSSVSRIPETHPTRPICSYGILKLAIEHYLGLFSELYGLSYKVIRAANVYGEGQRSAGGQGAAAAFLASALDKRPIEIWGDGSAVRDYVHIDDVVAALKKAAAISSNETVFNVGSGTGHSLLELLDAIDAAIGRKTPRIFKPSRKFDVPRNVLCIKRARSILDWRPKIPLCEGIARFANWKAQETAPSAHRARRRPGKVLGSVVAA